VVFIDGKHTFVSLGHPQRLSRMNVNRREVFLLHRELDGQAEPRQTPAANAPLLELQYGAGQDAFVGAQKAEFSRYSFRRAICGLSLGIDGI